jgi:hypothetical protein
MATEAPKAPSRIGRIAGVIISGMMGFTVGATIGFAIASVLTPGAVAAGADPFLEETFGFSFFLLLCPALLIFGPLFGWLGTRIRGKGAGRTGLASLVLPGVMGIAGGGVLSLAWFLLVAYTG